ncbi:MAG TPA: sporulation protein YqfD, partial [Firmicutes bacterium]|nr:sporulation protein YqfD [Bacillota bacterium]
FADCFLQDYYGIVKKRRRLACRTRAEQRRGLPFLIRRYRKRIGLLIGAVLMICLLTFLQNFIWNIEVRGNHTISTQRILAAAEVYGIKPGGYLPDLDLHRISHKLKLQFDNLSIVSINRTGSRIEIILRESSPKPEIEPDTPCNVIAAKAGQILYMDVLNGQAVVKRQDAVAKGDLLVSGIFEDKKGNTLLRHADAYILAQTEVERELRFSLSQVEKQYDPAEKQRYILSLFGLKIPLYIFGSSPENTEITSTYKPLVLFGTELPVGIYQNTHRTYTLERTSYTEEEAKELLQAEMERLEQTDFPNCKILSRDYTFRREQDTVILSAVYQCQENIALQTPIYLEEEADS